MDEMIFDVRLSEDNEIWFHVIRLETGFTADELGNTEQFVNHKVESGGIFSDSDAVRIGNALLDFVKFKRLKDRSPETQENKAMGAQYTGQSCGQCYGLRMVRTGTCTTCQDCGWNEGCG